MRIFAGVLAAALTAAAVAQVPNKLGYQGRLFRLDGSPETGVVQMTFTLYDSIVAGTALGCDAAAVALTDGFYSLHLGGLGNCLGATGAIQPAAFDGRHLWLEVSVGGNVMSPRQRLGTVAYAHRAGTAQNLRGGTVEATTVTVGGASGVSIDGTGITLGATTVVDASGKATVATGAGLTGDGSSAKPVAVAAGGVTNALLANDAASPAQVSGGAMQASGANVGVGVAAPGEKLHVDGNVRIEAGNRLIVNGGWGTNNYLQSPLVRPYGIGGE